MHGVDCEEGRSLSNILEVLTLGPHKVLTSTQQGRSAEQMEPPNSPGKSGDDRHLLPCQHAPSAKGAGAGWWFCPDGLNHHAADGTYYSPALNQPPVHIRHPPHRSVSLYGGSHGALDLGYVDMYFARTLSCSSDTRPTPGEEFSSACSSQGTMQPPLHVDFPWLALSRCMCASTCTSGQGTPEKDSGPSEGS